MSAPALIFEAIVKKQAVAASYNRADVTLAPQVIYTRHGELYVDAVTLERDGRPPRESKIGTFKLTGLGALRLTPRRYERSPLFEPEAEKYAGETLMVVELA
jgi:hypothetical protein